MLPIRVWCFCVSTNVWWKFDRVMVDKRGGSVSILILSRSNGHHISWPSWHGLLICSPLDCFSRFYKPNLLDIRITNWDFIHAYKTRVGYHKFPKTQKDFRWHFRDNLLHFFEHIHSTRQGTASSLVRDKTFTPPQLDWSLPVSLQRQAPHPQRVDRYLSHRLIDKSI